MAGRGLHYGSDEAAGGGGSPLTIRSFTRAIIHIDADAFFASCEQSRRPELRGRPVITGKERNIVASMSYEAKARGVIRAMRLSEVKKLCPDAVFLPSDYETYSLLSKRFFSIVRRYTPDVEEYGIDECFADITGMQRPLRMGYRDIARTMKEELDLAFGFTFSTGLAPNKTIAKIASKWEKPSGLTIIPGRDIHEFLRDMPVEKVWGIGPQTTAYLAKLGITTALEFARRDEEWVKARFSKPFYETWQELNGRMAIGLDTEEKDSYYTIQKVKTFTPPSSDPEFVFAQLSKNVENATMKARRYKLAAREAVCFLKTQDFQGVGAKVKFSRPTAFPHEVMHALEPVFERLFKPSKLYRSTGVVLLKLTEDTIVQPDLFGVTAKIERMARVYDAVDGVRIKYGKHTLFLGSSYYANRFAQHLGDRGDVPARKDELFKGETKRQRLGIPMFMGEVK
ncbi:MAG: DNA polymerase IV [Actinobacteria bacterium]|nr:DNA polymerase IV [Actinomycetota bacterium]